MTTIAPKFFGKPNPVDQQKDLHRLEQLGIDPGSRGQNKGAIVSEATDGQLGIGFAMNRGKADRKQDLAGLARLGLEDQGHRDLNKALIFNTVVANLDVEA